MKSFLQKVVNKENLTFEEMQEVSEGLLMKDVAPELKAGLLTALKVKGETTEEMAALVSTLKNAAVPFPHIQDAMDICGTGGDGSQSFNISTTSAFVLAAAGIKIAKHGNRSVSSKTGSSDLLFALGVPMEMSPAEHVNMLDECGITFLFAPHVHPKLKILCQEKSCLFRQIFNHIGPLANPIHLSSQLIGVYHKDLLPVFANVVKRLGRNHVMILHGAGGMDEASLIGRNEYMLIRDGEVKTGCFTPDEIGLPTYTAEDIRGGEVNKNVDITLEVLKGKEGPYLDTVLLNAACSLYASQRVKSFVEGVHIAREVIKSGKALEKLKQVQSFEIPMRKGVIL
ncbi:hypothetical protein Q73_07295 [Bacillus coahuilensis m2-6]|uniref:anthranilate phosphoribosyltransferase n=1 Tax=Bacillus coahuilensis TaxID=408580 RepID=UPI0007503850|nr:anthranilate phosphoribosyltransferase [Bacillus coahuilensis]KUP08158.1 hypothetical protein Q73_07295 [Bacillus coahuilensis m2-6]